MFMTWRTCTSLMGVKQIVATSACCRNGRPESTMSTGNSSQEARINTGILMLNMGGPSHVEEVPEFLLRLFSDRDLIQLPFQSWLAPRIARRRSPSIQHQYMTIGGGSPILYWTRRQGEAMVRRLEEVCPEMGPFKYYVGFNYAKPLITDTLQEMESDGVRHAIAFSQYPQYSCSTTGSSLNTIARHYLSPGTPASNMIWSVIDRWPTHPALIESITERIKSELLEFPAGVRNDVVILFSAHSLPQKTVSKGDPYPYEVGATVLRVMEALGWSHQYRLVWQSKVGPMRWLSPSTEQTIRWLPSQGKRDVLLVPIAFVNDHIETLYELDIEYMQHLAPKHGIRHIRRTQSLNDSPIFTQALAEIVKTHLTRGQFASCSGPRHLFLRCPGCDSTSCKRMRGFFTRYRMVQHRTATAGSETLHHQQQQRTGETLHQQQPQRTGKTLHHSEQQHGRETLHQQQQQGCETLHQPQQAEESLHQKQAVGAN